MASGTDIKVKCTNKLCYYTGVKTLWNGQLSMKEKDVCPKCGFKSLDNKFDVELREMIRAKPRDNLVFTTQESITNFIEGYFL